MHVARNNRQWCDPVIGEAMLVVHGAQHYVSPRWQPSLAEHGQVVPTWNYLTVHAYGELVAHDDPDWTLAAVRRVTALQIKVAEVGIEARLQFNRIFPAFFGSSQKGESALKRGPAPGGVFEGDGAGALYFKGFGVLHQGAAGELVLVGGKGAVGAPVERRGQIGGDEVCGPGRLWGGASGGPARRRRRGPRPARGSGRHDGVFKSALITVVQGAVVQGFGGKHGVGGQSDLGVGLGEQAIGLLETPEVRNRKRQIEIGAALVGRAGGLGPLNVRQGPKIGFSRVEPPFAILQIAALHQASPVKGGGFLGAGQPGELTAKGRRQFLGRLRGLTGGRGRRACAA